MTHGLFSLLSHDIGPREEKRSEGAAWRVLHVCVLLEHTDTCSTHTSAWCCSKSAVATWGEQSSKNWVTQLRLRDWRVCSGQNEAPLIHNSSHQQQQKQCTPKLRLLVGVWSLPREQYSITNGHRICVCCLLLFPLSIIRLAFITIITTTDANFVVLFVVHECASLACLKRKRHDKRAVLEGCNHKGAAGRPCSCPNGELSWVWCLRMLDASSTATCAERLSLISHLLNWQFLWLKLPANVSVNVWLLYPSTLLLSSFCLFFFFAFLIICCSVQLSLPTHSAHTLVHFNFKLSLDAHIIISCPSAYNRSKEHFFTLPHSTTTLPLSTSLPLSA